MLRAPAVPYVAPFVVFIVFLTFRRFVPLPELTEQVACLAIMAGVLLAVARPALDFRMVNVPGTVAIGVLVFAVWILPDYLFPGYRQHWLFSNSLMGTPQAGLAEAARNDTAVVILRALRASVIVPILEELFWRGWLMRWLISSDFQKVPLGAWSPQAFWIVAVLFASEHGPYWDVGFVAGAAYNWWMVRTKSLGDLILGHAVTNVCLSVYVIFGGRWEYWA